MIELAAVSAVAVLSTVALCFSLLRFIRREREAAAVERANLLQRIQAPAAEVVRYHYEQGNVEIPPAVRTDDEPGSDEDWERARVTKEDILAAMEAERGVNGG